MKVEATWCLDWVDVSVQFSYQQSAFSVYFKHSLLPFKKFLYFLITWKTPVQPVFPCCKIET